MLPSTTCRSYSIVSDWELICSHAWKAQFVNSAFFVGFLVGAGVFGMLSDRYGESEAWSCPAVASWHRSKMTWLLSLL